MDFGEVIINKFLCFVYKNCQCIGFLDNINLYLILNVVIVVDKKVEIVIWFELLEDSYIGVNKEIMGWVCGRRMNSEYDNLVV